MSKDITELFHDNALCKGLLQEIVKTVGDSPFRFMELCGTHTVAIFQSGISSILPKTIKHITGPGCPVCVTHEEEIESLLLSENKDVIITTFGDVMRVPNGNGRSLKHAQADGADIRIVYSALDAVEIAKNNPQKKIVFVGIGFETTAPTIAAAILFAKSTGVKNFSVLSFHKTVPAVLKVLLKDEDFSVDAFMLPGHVALVTGIAPFQFVAEKYKIPCTITGFEPADILQSILDLVKQSKNKQAEVHNLYTRAVRDAGSKKAMEILYSVFEDGRGFWRGMGEIADSGLNIQ